MLKEISEREKDLKEQLNLYTAKYDDFQNSLQKSNDIFATYKVELEKVSDHKNEWSKDPFWFKKNSPL